MSRFGRIIEPEDETIFDSDDTDYESEEHDLIDIYGFNKTVRRAGSMVYVETYIAMMLNEDVPYEDFRTIIKHQMVKGCNSHIYIYLFKGYVSKTKWT